MDIKVKSNNLMLVSPSTIHCDLPQWCSEIRKWYSIISRRKK